MPLSGGNLIGGIEIQKTSKGTYGTKTSTTSFNENGLTTNSVDGILNLSTVISPGQVTTINVKTSSVSIDSSNAFVDLNGSKGLTISDGSYSNTFSKKTIDIADTTDKTTKKMSLSFNKIEYYDDEDKSPT